MNTLLAIRVISKQLTKPKLIPQGVYQSLLSKKKGSPVHRSENRQNPPFTNTNT